MKTVTKVMLIIGAVLVLAGAAIFVAVMAPGNWNFKGLGTAEFVTETIDVDGEFADILIDTNMTAVVIQPSTTGKCRVAFFNHKKVTCSASVKDGVLQIETEDARKWYERISFSIDYEMVVYLPQSEYGSLTVRNSTGRLLIPREFSFGNIDAALSTGNVDCKASASGRIKIKTNTGNVRLEGVTAGGLELSATTGNISLRSVSCGGGIDLSVSTGKTTLEDVSCKSLSSKGSTGKLSLENVIAEETLSVERSTGSVRFEKCDARDFVIRTSTGNVKGSLLTGKVFSARSDTGRVKVPESTAGGGTCSVTTDTGSITITVDTGQ